MELSTGLTLRMAGVWTASLPFPATAAKPGITAFHFIFRTATVTINNTKYKVVKIDQKAFRKCTKLKKITIGKHISAIDKHTFQGCKNLYRIILKGAALKPNKIKTGAFKNTSPKMKVIVSKSMKKRQRAMLLNKMKRAGMHKKAAILFHKP